MASHRIQQQGSIVPLQQQQNKKIGAPEGGEKRSKKNSIRNAFSILSLKIKSRTEKAADSKKKETTVISKLQSSNDYDNDDDDHRSYISNSSLLLIQELRQQLPIPASPRQQRNDKSISDVIINHDRYHNNTFDDHFSSASFDDSKDLAKQMERAFEEDGDSSIGSLPSIVLFSDDADKLTFTPSMLSSFTSSSTHNSDDSSYNDNNKVSHSLGSGTMGMNRYHHQERIMKDQKKNNNHCYSIVLLFISIIIYYYLQL